MDAGSFLMRGVQAFCWMLIHSLWQAMLLTLLTGLVILLTRGVRSSLRFRLVQALLAVFFFGCAATLANEWNAPDSGRVQPFLEQIFNDGSFFAAYGFGNILAAVSEYCSEHAAFIVVIWFAVFCYKCLRLNFAFMYVNRIRRAKCVDAPEEWRGKLEVLAQEMGVRRTVQFMESALARVPCVIGHLKPVIFIPVGLLANLPSEQVEAALLHELAHIRRNDYLNNLLYNITETIFFFNPGLLWITAVLKREAEDCCDDMAVSVSGRKREYIQALISFKEHSFLSPAGVPAFAAGRSQLLQRVTRIIQNRNSSLTAVERIFFLSGIVLIPVLLALFAAQQVRHEAETQTRQSARQASMERAEPVFSLIVSEEAKKAREEEREAAERIKTDRSIVEANRNMAEADPEMIMEEPENSDAEEMESEHQQVLEDMREAKADRLQADRDRRQAELDGEQAERDRQQEETDRQQAIRDREQAQADQQEAERQRRDDELEAAATVREASDARSDRQNFRENHSRHTNVDL